MAKYPLIETKATNYSKMVQQLTDKLCEVQYIEHLHDWEIYDIIDREIGPYFDLNYGN